MPLHKLNFRDLGGTTAAGGEIRPGKLLRSEGPANFSDEQRSAIAGLGVRNIIDLRSKHEREKDPYVWHGPDCTWHGLEVNADLRVFGNDGRERLQQGPDAQIAIDTMVETYADLPEAMATHWRTIGTCLQDDAGASLVNCTAGKDRTGVAVAVILELAGVARDAIMEDYMRSNIFGENIRQSGKLEAGFTASYGFMPSPGQVEALIGVRSEYLDAAWDAIDRQWSGVAGYLDASGINEAQQDQIRKVMVRKAG